MMNLLSSRAVAWQNVTGPRPLTLRVTLSGRLACGSRRPARSWPRTSRSRRRADWWAGRWAGSARRTHRRASGRCCPAPTRPARRAPRRSRVCAGMAVGQVPVQHDRVHCRGFHLTQDRLQRRQVAVDVGQHLATRMASSLVRYCRSRARTVATPFAHSCARSTPPVLAGPGTTT